MKNCCQVLKTLSVTGSGGLFFFNQLIYFNCLHCFYNSANANTVKKTNSGLV